MYHFSMFHASHHITPIPATEDEVFGYLSHFIYLCLFLFMKISSLIGLKLFSCSVRLRMKQMQLKLLQRLFAR